MRKTKMESNYLHISNGGISFTLYETREELIRATKNKSTEVKSFSAELEMSNFGYCGTFSFPILSPNQAREYAGMLMRLANRMEDADEQGHISEYSKEFWSRSVEPTVTCGSQIVPVHKTYVLGPNAVISVEVGINLVSTETGGIVTHTAKKPKELRQFLLDELAHIYKWGCGSNEGYTDMDKTSVKLEQLGHYLREPAKYNKAIFGFEVNQDGNVIGPRPDWFPDSLYPWTFREYLDENNLDPLKG